jgi:hypothetical protein
MIQGIYRVFKGLVILPCRINFIKMTAKSRAAKKGLK